MTGRTNKTRTRNAAENNGLAKRKIQATIQAPRGKQLTLVGAPISTDPADAVQVRKNVNSMVWNAAETIATEIINVAMSGQLAAAKYLFEAVGMYPAPKEIMEEKTGDNSLAHILLKRLGLPTEPITCDDHSAEKGDTVK